MIATKKRKNPATFAPGRKDLKKGGPTAAAKLTSAQLNKGATVDTNTFANFKDEAMPAIGDTSDNAVLALLERIKLANNQAELRNLTDQLQSVIFHKQYKNTSA